MVILAESGGKPFGDPIPIGMYDILEHRKLDSFRLEPLDSCYGNDVDEKTKRYHFRLHQPGNTTGCIAALDEILWQSMRDFIYNMK